MGKEILWRDCLKCKEQFIVKPTKPLIMLCPDCATQLSRCDACGIVVSCEYDYIERQLVSIGNSKVCGTCYEWLQREGSIEITPTPKRLGRSIMLKDGTIDKGEAKILRVWLKELV